MTDPTSQFNSIWGVGKSTPTTPATPAPNLNQQFDQIWGTRTPPSNAPATSRSQEILNIAKQAQQPEQLKPTGPTGPFSQDENGNFNNPKTPFSNMVGDIGTGIVKGAGSTVIGLGQVALKGLSLIPGFKDMANDAIQTGEDIKKEQFTPKNTAQTVGKTGEQIGEMFIPTGLEEKVAGVLSKIPELGKDAPIIAKVLQSVLKLGAKSVASGAEFAGKTYLQTGGDAKQALETGVIAGAVPIAGAGLKAGGEALAESVIPKSAKEAQLLQTYKADIPFWDRVSSFVTGNNEAPITAGKTAFDKGLMGTESGIGVGAKKAGNSLWNNLVKPALDSSDTKVNLNSFFDEAKQQIIKDNPELNRQKDLLEALNALQEPYVNIKNATLNELQKFKEGWAKFVPEKAYRGKPIAGAFNEVKDVVSGIARNKIYDSLGPQVKQAYFDYGNLKGLQELGQKAMTGGKLKGGFGSFWSAIKDMLVVPAGTIGGQTIYKVGHGIEMFGKQGAKTISELLSQQ